jgi:hypothetical protein
MELGNIREIGEITGTVLKGNLEERFNHWLIVIQISNLKSDYAIVEAFFLIFFSP